MMTNEDHLDCAPDGWKPIVNETHEMLSFLDPDYAITQIKEKFGALRYYYSSDKSGIEANIMSHLVSSAEQQSYYICETCGQPGTTRNGGWIRTLCDECNDAR